MPYRPTEPTTLRVWLLDYAGESDWVIAETADEARAMALADHGWNPQDLDEHVTITALPAADPLKVYQGEPYQEPTPSITLTAAEWCQRSGAGVLATTLF